MSGCNTRLLSKQEIPLLLLDVVGEERDAAGQSLPSHSRKFERPCKWLLGVLNPSRHRTIDGNLKRPDQSIKFIAPLCL
jgi:hypothetical protein